MISKVDKLDVDELVAAPVELSKLSDVVNIKDSNGLKINSVNLLHLVINKLNGYFENINKNKYLTLFLTNETKEIIIIIYQELWNKIRNAISSVTKNSDDHDEKIDENQI